MASTSANRFNNAVTTLVSENQALIAEIRKSIGLIKTVALDLEKDHQSDKVKQLDDAVLELLDTYGDCQHYCEAIQNVGNSYQPSEQLTDFEKLLEEHYTRAKAESRAVSDKDQLYRKFKEAVWNVHHEGQPMPGEEQEDIVMTSTQNVLLNITCPLTGKPVVELENPVRCMDCKHIYEKDPIMHYIRGKKTQSKCPVAGCPRVLQAARVVCDPLLLIEINEMRSSEKTAVNATNVEDFTEIGDDD